MHIIWISTLGVFEKQQSPTKSNVYSKHHTYKLRCFCKCVQKMQLIQLCSLSVQISSQVNTYKVLFKYFTWSFAEVLLGLPGLKLDKNNNFVEFLNLVHYLVSLRIIREGLNKNIKLWNFPPKLSILTKKNKDPPNWIIK